MPQPLQPASLLMQEFNFSSVLIIHHNYTHTRARTRSVTITPRLCFKQIKLKTEALNISWMEFRHTGGKNESQPYHGGYQYPQSQGHWAGYASAL